jgi:hypothetical protein
MASRKAKLAHARSEIAEVCLNSRHVSAKSQGRANARPMLRDEAIHF